MNKKIIGEKIKNVISTMNLVIMRPATIPNTWGTTQKHRKNNRKNTRDRKAEARHPRLRHRKQTGGRCTGWNSRKLKKANAKWSGCWNDGQYKVPGGGTAGAGRRSRTRYAEDLTETTMMEPDVAVRKEDFVEEQDLDRELKIQLPKLEPKNTKL